MSNSGVLSITQGSGISITGSDGSFTITATGGVAGTVATADLVSTVIGIQIIGSSNLTSTSKGLGLLGYLSSFATISSINISSGSLFSFFLSSQQITASSIRANNFVGDGSLLTNLPGSGLATTDLTSTVSGLGTAGYLSSSAELISSPQLTSSIVGLGTFGYLSSLTTISSLNISSGSIYASLLSSQQITVSSITANKFVGDGSLLVNVSGTGGITLPELVSSIEGLGTLQYVSSTQMISSIEGLGLMGNLQLTSSIEGLGSIGYLSSFNVLSTLNMSSGSVFTSTMSTTETNAGRLNFGELFNNGTKLIDANGNILFTFQNL